MFGPERDQHHVVELSASMSDLRGGLLAHDLWEKLFSGKRFNGSFLNKKMRFLALFQTVFRCGECNNDHLKEHKQSHGRENGDKRILERLREKGWNGSRIWDTTGFPFFMLSKLG